jgi:hypothetical protein
MKKLIFILTMCIAISAFAQNSFPTSNAMWNEKGYGYDQRLLGLLGDTIIDGVHYSTLYEFSDTILLKENVIRSICPLIFEGEKVWIGTQILLYDFSAEVGDTIWHNGCIPAHTDSFYDGEDYYSVIKSISTYNGKRIYDVHFFSDNFCQINTSWIEGIGSSHGLFKSIPVFALFDSPDNYNLNCFKHNDTVRYQNNYDCNKCFCKQTSIENDELSTNLINIFPNPTKDVLNIEVQGNVEIQSISIYAINGKLVEKNTYKVNIKQINLSALKEGNYIISIDTDKGVFNKSIIKK